MLAVDRLRRAGDRPGAVPAVVPADLQPTRAKGAGPDFVIIGAQKSASTFLHYCLSQHPDIFVQPGEVPIFEDPDYAAYHPAFFVELFQGHREPCLGIRRPNYLGRPEVAGRIAEILPDAKLVAVLRNPIDRAVSAAYHQMAESFIPLMDIEECMWRVIAGELQGRYPRSSQILEFGLYHKYLSTYPSYFERGLMFVVLQDRFVQDKQPVLRDVFRFLGVDDALVPGDLVSKKQPGHYHPLTQRLARLANTISHYRDEENLRAHPRGLPARILGRCVKEAANIIEVKLLKQRRPRISERCRADLYAYYRDDIESLERLAGLDCSAWKHGPAAPAGPARA